MVILQGQTPEPLKAQLHASIQSNQRSPIYISTPDDRTSHKENSSKLARNSKFQIKLVTDTSNKKTH